MNARHVATLEAPDGGLLFEMRLAGVAVDPHDRVYVLGDTCALCYSPEFAQESRLDLDAVGWSVYGEADAVWVGFDGKIVKYSPAGKVLATIRDPGRLGRVTAVASCGDDLVAADATNRAVHRYTRDGKYVGPLGDKANTRGFMIPNGILDLVGDPSTQSVLVAHPQKHRVERYESAGPLVAKWGRFGMHDPADFGGCCNPTNIAVAADGMIAVSEKAPPRIKLYDAVGEFKLVVAQELFDPNTKNIDLAFDSRNRLFATDPLRRNVHVFQVSPNQDPSP